MPAEPALGGGESGRTGRARALEERLAALLEGRQLLVAANRGPAGFVPADGGGFTAVRGPGGVVTALGALARYAEPIWIAAAQSPADYARAAAPDTPAGDVIATVDGARHRLRFVTPGAEAYDRYYNVIANPLLWFVQHYLWDLAAAPEIDAATWNAWHTGYVAVNGQFAATILAARDDTAAREPLIMIHDYHLYLCPRLVRREAPGALIHYFVHIPWPGPEYWRLLPSRMRAAICDGLLGCDIVGFQTATDARNFLLCCDAVLPDATIDLDRHRVDYDGRQTTIRTYPISVDVDSVREAATRPDTAARLAAYQSGHTGRLIVRTDRVEPSKNILRGFSAYRELLEAHPEWRGDVTFLALLSPSRLSVPLYRAYLDRVRALVATINEELGEPGWQPIDLHLTSSYSEALAGLRCYDVLLVNSLFDGMNLVAKEGALVNERDGVLVLSEGAGAYQQLRGAALGIAPCDVSGTAEAMHQALLTPADERYQRARHLRALVERDDNVAWLRAQFDDLATVVSSLATENGAGAIV